jgi:PAS domain S-box-containing protein
MAKRAQPAAEEASQESKKLVQELLDSFPAPVYAVDADGRFLLTNRRLDTLLGVAAGQAISKTREDFLPAEIADEHRKNDLAVIRSGRSSTSEEENIEPDGRHVYSSIKFPLHDARGRIYAIGGISTDITERKRVEHQLRGRTKELQALYSLAGIAEREDISLDEVYQGPTDILPNSWQYPEIACAKVRIGDREFRTGNFAESPWRQSAPVRVSGTVIGAIDVSYLDERPDEDEGPFLKEERRLIDALAERLGRITERLRLGEELRGSQELLSLYLRHSPIYTFIKSVTPTESRVLHASDSLQQLTGILARDMVGKTMAELFPAELAVKMTADDWAVVSTGEVLTLDEDLDGRNYTTVKFPIIQGGRTLLAGYTLDITERKQAEGALREGERRYALALEAANDGIFDVDLRTGATHYSARYAEMLGYGPTELVFSPQSGTWERLLHPDDKEKALRALGRCLSGETKEYGEEFRLRTKAGDWCWIESRARVAERDPAGNPLRLVGSHRDITERKKADDALHESEDRYRSLVSNVPGVIFTMDLEGKITFVSRRIEEMLGYEGSDVVNRSILDFIPEEERQKAMESLQKGVTGEGVKHFQTPVMRKSGERLLLECSFARVRKDGRVVGVQGTAVDITERKRAEEVLRESERSARQRAEELRVVGQVTTAITAGLGIEQLMQTLYEQCQLLFPIDTFYIVLYDAATDSVSFPFMQKDGERRLLPSRYLRAEPGLLEHVIRGRQTVYLPDAAHSPIPMVRQPGAVSQSIVAVPMILRDLVIGVLSMQSRSSDVYSLEQIQLFERLVSQVATAIQNSRLYETVSHGLEATLTALGRAAERRDPYTAGHQRRVTDLSLAIARKLEYGEDACTTLRTAGMLHDIGKLGVPAEILSKPSALSKIEMELIRTHPQAAYEILADIAFPGPVAEIVLQHHERQDGSGYPKKISGDDILPEARILAVADVVEAMASHRPYRPALGIAAALDEIRAGRGTRYDQQVVDACVALFESSEFSFQPASVG